MSKRGMSTARAVLVAGGISVAAATFAAGPSFAAGADVRVTETGVKAGGSFTVSAICAKGADEKSASVSLTVIGGPSEAPLAKIGGGSVGFESKFKVPKNTKPGNYNLNVTCGDGGSDAATLTVVPSGVIKTGGGATSAGVNQGLVAGGAGLVAVAALGGALLVRRRKADGSI